jgi:hypothetical protein
MLGYTRKDKCKEREKHILLEVFIAWRLRGTVRLLNNRHARWALRR